MANLFKDTVSAMKSCDKSVKDVAWVGTAQFHTDWATFAKECMDYEYSSGFGGAEVAMSLKVVFHDGTWLERGEYDGSEWWNYMELPEKPETSLEQYRGTEENTEYEPRRVEFPWGYNRALQGSRWG